MKYRRAPIVRPADSEKALRSKGQGHLAAIAPTRVGKSSGDLIAELLKSPSVVIIDPKSELFCVTSQRRKRHGKVIFLDRFGEVRKGGLI